MKEQRIQARWQAREARHVTEGEVAEAVDQPAEGDAAQTAAARVKANRQAFGEFLSMKRPKKH